MLMDTLSDYLHWIGHYSFSEIPLGEVDQLLFSIFTYVRFEHLERRRYTLPEASEAMAGLSVDKEDKARAEDDLRVLSEAARTRRYSSVELALWEEKFDKELEVQFFGAAFVIPGYALVVAFRGTDSHLVSWKEDFNMAFTETVPAQEAALAFLEEAMEGIPCLDCYITGHSKGGNLSLYSYLKAPQALRERVAAAYSNDGPGFNDQSLLDAIDSKVAVFLPQASVVGLLLAHPEEYTVVRSSSISLLQHDPHTWCLDGPGFERSEGLSKGSELFDRKLRDFLLSRSEEEREEFINSAYKLLDTLSLEEAKKNPVLLKDTIPEAMKLIKGQSAEYRKAMLSFLFGLIGTFFPENKEEFQFLLKL